MQSYRDTCDRVYVGLHSVQMPITLKRTDVHLINEREKEEEEKNINEEKE